jgi:sugar (glycoside-pentoside-hexuronide) transporter
MTGNTAIATPRERLAYGWYFTGQNLVYLFVMNYIQNYFTDVVGIAAGTVAFILLAARVFDAANDPLFGVAVDKSRLKGGRFKPWLRLAALLLPAFTIGMFCVPQGWALEAKTLVCGALYFVWGMAYTMCDAPAFSLATVMTNNMLEKSSLIAKGRFHSFLGILIVLVVTVPLTGALGERLIGGPHSAWRVSSIIFSISGMLLMLPISGIAKERFVDQDSEPIKLNSIAKCLMGNKNLLALHGSIILSSLTNTVAVLPLYFSNVNLANSGLYPLVIISTMIGAPLVPLALPKLAKRFDKFHIYLFGLSLTIISSAASYFIGYEGSRFIPFLIISAVRGLAFSCCTVLFFMFSSDCIEYGDYKTGSRAEGVTFSMQTFTTKLTGAISGFVAMGLLGWLFGYQSARYEGNLLVIPEQSALAAQGIWLMYSIFPAIGAVAALLVLLRFYKLRDKDVQVMADVNQGLISREEGERRLAQLKR